MWKDIKQKEHKSQSAVLRDDRDLIILRIDEQLERLEAQHKTCV